MSQHPPYTITSKPHGIMYEHVIRVHNAVLGSKISPSPIAPQWMRHRAAAGNTASLLDGSFKGPVGNPPITMQHRRLPRAVT